MVLAKFFQFIHFPVNSKYTCLPAVFLVLSELKEDGKVCVWSRGSGGSRGGGRGHGAAGADMADTIFVVYFSHWPSGSITWARNIATIIPTGSAV